MKVAKYDPWKKICNLQTQFVQNNDDVKFSKIVCERFNEANSFTLKLLESLIERNSEYKFSGN